MYKMMYRRQRLMRASSPSFASSQGSDLWIADSGFALAQPYTNSAVNGPRTSFESAVISSRTVLMSTAPVSACTSAGGSYRRFGSSRSISFLLLRLERAPAHPSRIFAVGPTCSDADLRADTGEQVADVGRRKLIGVPLQSQLARPLVEERARDDVTRSVCQLHRVVAPLRLAFDANQRLAVLGVEAVVHDEQRQLCQRHLEPDDAASRDQRSAESRCGNAVPAFG